VLETRLGFFTTPPLQFSLTPCRKMLIFDQLKKNDPQLRILAVVILVGLFVLVGGLWWVQIVSSQEYQASLQTQSVRTVRIPAVRGKILDRNGVVLAENRPVYNLVLHLDEMRSDFESAYKPERLRVLAQLKKDREAQEQSLRRSLSKEERRQFLFTTAKAEALKMATRYAVASNMVAQIGERLHLGLSLNSTNFEKHYRESLFAPMPVCTNLAPAQIALFSEQSASLPAAEIEMQSTRVYPQQTLAAHVIGSVRRDTVSVEGEDASVSYRLPDYYGELGVEWGYDKELRGKAGIKTVVVNNVGYRQTENIWEEAQAGQNIVLTIDIQLQKKVESALHVYGPTTRGAAVVLDARTGDVLAMASSPTINPNDPIQGMTAAEMTRRNDLKLRPVRNRATQENYAPGSIFKTVVGLVALDAGVDPNEKVYNSGAFRLPHARPIGDLAKPGYYDFRLALMHSCNTWFITYGLRVGIANIVNLAHELHLGEKCDLRTRQETSGSFPSLQRVSSRWYDGDTANVCIGQGEIEVTPLQMALMTAAIANGGTVMWPRLVDRIEPLSLDFGGETNLFPRGRVRDHLTVKRKSLELTHEAMLADVQSDGGTGTKAAVPGLNICGKTGTAQVMDPHNHVIADTTWFASFAPYENPKYVVLAMIEVEPNAGTGGSICAPIANKIYRALLEMEKPSPAVVKLTN
jgi:penicillin-binding protein 2